MAAGADCHGRYRRAPRIGFGTVTMDVLSSMAGIDFVRGVFDGTLPHPPIMQTVEPFDCTDESEEP